MVVKIGGALLENPAQAVEAIREALTEDAVVVHGGGIQITRMLERLNVESRFVDGLRVTDRRTLFGVCLALMGEVHTELVQAMIAAGLPAIGLFGAVHARHKDGPWGFVGGNVQTDGETLSALLNVGRIPVIPALALNDDSLLNVNGDETAAALAVDLQAHRLVFLTDVPGVKDEAGKVISHARNVDALLGSSFVSGGMRPKLRAVQTALGGGVQLVSVGRTVFESAL
jgi:acetylglutamate kinase